MCEIAKKLGYCPLDIEDAAKIRNAWCGDREQQARCGNEVAQKDNTYYMHRRARGAIHDGEFTRASYSRGTGDMARGAGEKVEER